MRRSAAIVVAAVVAAGCAFAEVLADYGDPVDMRSEDLVGTWFSGTSSSSPRIVTFEIDGTFVATDLPEKRFGRHSADDRDPIDGRGSWELRPPARDPDGPATIVALSFEVLGGVDTRFEDHLVAAEFDGVVLLVFWFEDGYTVYAKCMGHCSSLRPSPGP
jgi:hypothetical protein